MYRAKAVTQRDGGPLASQNCRMASICTGLDFDSLGKKRSTGSQMRKFTRDQSGGTDSSDAKEAWAKGYQEALLVQDGETFDRAVAMLKAGRLVHLDVWHEYAYVCLSGTGRYGHTMAVAPERSGTKWLVADPWCLPGKWGWVEEATLRRGAEAWGRKVFSTGGERMPRERLIEIAQSRARELMSRFHAGGDEDPDPVPPVTGETSGPQPILFTATTAHPEEVDVPAIQLKMIEPYDGSCVTKGAGHYWIRVWDGFFGGPVGDKWGPKQVFAKAQVAKAFSSPGGSTTFPIGTKVVLIGDDLAFFLEADVTLTPKAPTAEYVPVGELYVKKT